MPANPKIEKVQSHGPQHSYLYIFLKNEGTTVLSTGELFAKHTAVDGTVRDIRIRNSTTLEPSETTKLGTNVFDPKSIKILRYVEDRGETFPLDLLIRRGWLGFSVG